jgi:endonuclease/exonuclease/phosphatase family metal-dependent hydrolase
MRTFTRIVVLIINTLFVFGTVLIIAAVNISPVHLWYLAMIGFSFPIVMIFHFIFVFFWLLTRHKLYSIISLVCIVIGFFIGGFPYEFHKKTKEKGIKIMTYNVKNFDLYNWHGNFKLRDSIIDYLKEIKPDIICFQEYYNDKVNTYNTNDSLRRILHLPYVHYESLVKVNTIYDFGMATLSKYPILHQSKLFDTKRSTNNVIVTDIKIGNDTIRIFNCHMESIHLVKSNFETIDKIKDRTYNSSDSSGLHDIIKKLKKGFYKRASQADTVSLAIKNSPYPVFVCGDFNDISLSYTYHTIKTHNDLVDAFRNSGHGMGGTYIGKLPSFRIDYILHSKSITSWNFNTGNKILSDHYPIYCRFKISHDVK